MKVFISSTCYDLIDVRAELCEYFRSEKITPVLSDDKLSDFEVYPNANSIQSCLLNVENCDHMVVILNQRYGPRLGKCGFDDVSATHLEYKAAANKKIPIHVFVRDRLAADYSIWKKNSRNSSLELNWIDAREIGLFQLLDEHSKLFKNETNNWFDTFTSSVDLKAAIAKRFRPKLLPVKLLDAINQNNFPLFEVEVEVNCSLNRVHVATIVKNVGGSPAFSVRSGWTADNQTLERMMIAPLRDFHMEFIINRIPNGPVHGSRALFVHYSSAIGISVEDHFEIEFDVRIDGTQVKGGRLANRRFVVAPELQIELHDE